MVAVVEDEESKWVAKSPLQRLAVADEWIVDRQRGGNEAAILCFLDGCLGPLRTPRLRFFDAGSAILGEELIAGESLTYKDELLAGRSHPEISKALGAALSELQRLDPPDTLSGDGPRALFDGLRLDAYYRVSAQRLAEHRDSLFDLIADTLAASPRTFVHGDLTPKNVLVTDDTPVLLDWEVVHVGDPAFDLGMLTAHLLLKAIRGNAKGGVEPILEDAREFWVAYEGPASRRRALRHTGAIMLARLYGKSPVEYLVSPTAREQAYEVAERALSGDVDEIEDLMEFVRSVLSDGEH